MHGGLVGGGRGAVLELAVHHPGVGVGGAREAGWAWHEPAVPALLVAGQSQHRPTGGRVVRGEAPGDAGDRDEDDADTWNKEKDY